MKTVEEHIEYFKPLSSALTIACIIMFFSILWRMKVLKEYFVTAHGYSQTWKSREYFVGSGSGTDPRIARNMKDCITQKQYLTFFQAFFCDLPWLTIGIFHGSNYKLNTFGILSILSSAFGLGMKFTSILDLIKQWLKKKVPLLKVWPAEIRMGLGNSSDENASKAICDTYNDAVTVTWL